VAGHGGGATVRLRQRDEDPDGRRLAGAVRAEQPVDLAFADGEADPVERADILAVRLLEAVDDDRVHAVEASGSLRSGGERSGGGP
jgi:hypothetical protein